MTENKVEQHNNKRYQMTIKFTLIRISLTMLANINSKWIKDLPSLFA